MENNIENNIKKAFRNREIQPSTNAWKVLEAKLNTAETKQKSMFFKYLAYASIFIGLLLGLYVYINPFKTKKTQKELITKEIPKLKFKNLQPKSEIVIASTKKETTTLQKNNKQIVIKTKKKKPKITLKKDDFSKKNSEKTTQIVFKKLKKVVKKENKIPIMKKQNSIYIIDNNNKIVVKHIDKDTKIKKKLFTSDAELNQLLISAINLEKSKKNTTKPSLNIKNEQLLYSLENEINKPIKTKLLDKLLKGAKTVDTYLSRN